MTTPLPPDTASRVVESPERRRLLNIYVFKSKDMKIIVTVKAGKVVYKTKVDL